MTTPATMHDIALPTLPSRVGIEIDWLNRRDSLLKTAVEFKQIDGPTTFQAATDALGAITKHSNRLEDYRTQLSGPYTEAAKCIKQAADKARAPLETEKSRLKTILSHYAEQERKKAAAAAAEAERLRQEEISRQVQQQTIAEDLGLPPVEPVDVAPILPAVAPPRAFGATIKERVTFEVIDADKVPAAFKIVDERLVNAYIRENGAAIKGHVTGGNATGLVPGIKFKIETDVASR